MSDLATIRRFLECRRLALVGVSRNPKDFSRTVLGELLARGYDVVPVNPGATELGGRRCYRAVKDIEPRVEAALLMTPPAQSASAVQDCVEAGVPLIWFHRGIGQGSVSPDALQMCEEHAVSVVAGECPYMFLPRTGLPHRIHGFFRRLRGARRPAA